MTELFLCNNPGSRTEKSPKTFPSKQQIFARYHLPFRTLSFSFITAAAAALPEVIQPSTGLLPPLGGPGAKVKSILPKRVSEDSMKVSG